MRVHSLVVRVVLCAPALLIGCASQNTDPSSTIATTSGSADFSGDFRPIETGSATLVVRGLSCPKCANNVTLQLRKAPGVGDVHVDMGAGEVRVEFAQLAPRHPSKAQLAQAIDDAGFTLVDIRTP